MESQPLLISLGIILTGLVLIGVFVGWLWVALIVVPCAVYIAYLNRPSQRRLWKAEYEGRQATTA